MKSGVSQKYKHDVTCLSFCVSTGFPSLFFLILVKIPFGRTCKVASVAARINRDHSCRVHVVYLQFVGEQLAQTTTT